MLPRHISMLFDLYSVPGARRSANVGDGGCVLMVLEACRCVSI